MQLFGQKLKCDVNINLHTHVHMFYIDNMTCYIVEARMIFHTFLVFLCLFDYHISFLLSLFSVEQVIINLVT